MQEEAGGVALDNAASGEPEAKKSRRKKARIPTVAAVVAQEQEAASAEPHSAEEGAGASGMETAPGAVEASEAPADSGTAEPAAAAADGHPEPEAVPEAPRGDAAEQSPEAAPDTFPGGTGIPASVNLDSECALLETVLFLESEGQTVESLSKITGYAPDVVQECLDRLRQKYTAPDSGLSLSQIAGGWLLTPRRDCFDLVKERYGKRNEGKLSRAAIETLAIIAYSQPITRPEIESIRHVNADNMMRQLLERKFIKEVGKKDVPGKPVMYGTTKEFLEFFHLQSIAELPKLDEKESERFKLAR